MKGERIREDTLEFFRQHKEGTAKQICLFISDLPVKAQNGVPFENKKRHYVPDVRTMVKLLKRMGATRNKNGIWRM